MKTQSNKPVSDRPDNRSVENEALKTDGDGHPPRSATEPAGAKWSVQSDKTATDPSSGEPNDEKA